MFHEVATLVHPIESSKRAARAQGIPSIVLLEVPRLRGGRQYLVSEAINNLWRDKACEANKISGDFVLISPMSVSRLCRRDKGISRDARRFLQPAMAWEGGWG